VVAKYSQRARLAHQLHDAARVRPLGHEVAGQNHAVAPNDTALAQESLQLVQAAVNVTDYDGSFHETHPS